MSEVTCSSPSTMAFQIQCKLFHNYVQTSVQEHKVIQYKEPRNTKVKYVFDFLLVFYHSFIYLCIKTSVKKGCTIQFILEKVDFFTNHGIYCKLIS